MIKKYRESDFEEINSWHHKRGLYGVKKSDLPKHGFIVKGVGAGFLYKTDASFCILEGFITNPDASSSERGRALTEITECLLEMSKKLKYSKVIAITKDNSIKQRAEVEGFKKLGDYEVMVMGE